MLRILVALTLLTTALPLATAAEARPAAPCDGSTFCEVGPCLVGSSPISPGYALLVTCRDYTGDEMVFVAWYTCDGGLNGLGVRVYGRGHDCLTPRSLIEDLLPQTTLP
ncbi:MAG TPA: hypothetical protein VHH36_02705 [Candidatus Thermoplasmatota archaeon]|nr:hypothetical protein [Candidatus Thermoplasmatota archaeon]